MQIVHVYLTGQAGNERIYTFDYDDGKALLTSREIVLPYAGQSIEHLIEELSYQFVEEKSDGQEQEFYRKPDSSGEFWD